MTQPPASSPLSSLKKCLTLAQNVETQEEAKQMFEPLYEKMLSENPQAAEIMELLWQEVIAARRSAAFWQQISEYEKNMADQILQSLAQARQNYLRLLQEM